jgi:hypothetical protein
LEINKLFQFSKKSCAAQTENIIMQSLTRINHSRNQSIAAKLKVLSNHELQDAVLNKIHHSNDAAVLNQSIIV